MDIDKILEQLAGLSGKRKGDLKRIYNNLIKKKAEEGITKKLLGENFERIIFIGVCNKYDIPIESLDEFINEETKEEDIEEEETKEETEEDEEIDWDDNEEEEDDDDDEIDWDEDDDEDDDSGSFDEFDDVDHGEGDGSWESIFDKTPKPKSGESSDYETLESIQQVAGTKYYFKLADPEEKPYIYEGVGKDNKDYVSYALDVILVRLSPKRRYDDKYKKGDNRGKKMFVVKKKYKLWLSQTAWNWFVAFWVDDLGLSAPDGRIFSYEKVKLEKVTEYYFAAVKRKK